MVGTLLCTRAAMQVMQKQTSGGHIFNMDGAGADGMPTPQYAAYGATKAGSVPPILCVVCDYFSCKVAWICYMQGTVHLTLADCSASPASLLNDVVMHGTVHLRLADMAQQHQCVRLLRSCRLEPFVETSSPPSRA